MQLWTPSFPFFLQPWIVSRNPTTSPSNCARPTGASPAALEVPATGVSGEAFSGRTPKRRGGQVPRRRRSPPPTRCPAPSPPVANLSGRRGGFTLPLSAQRDHVTGEGLGYRELPACPPSAVSRPSSGHPLALRLLSPRGRDSPAPRLSLAPPPPRPRQSRGAGERAGPGGRRRAGAGTRAVLGGP